MVVGIRKHRNVMTLFSISDQHDITYQHPRGSAHPLLWVSVMLTVLGPVVMTVHIIPFNRFLSLPFAMIIMTCIMVRSPVPAPPVPVPVPPTPSLSPWDESDDRSGKVDVRLVVSCFCSRF